MIISNSKIKKIRDLIRTHYNALIFKVAGGENLSDTELQELVDVGLINPANDGGKIKDGYYIGRARNTMDPRLRDDMTLSQFEQTLKPQVTVVSDKEKYALEHISQSAGNFISNLKEKTKTNIEQIITNYNLEHRNNLLTDTVRTPLMEGIIEDSTVSQIASDIREKTGDLFRDWKRVATTELSTAMNLGEADAIAARNKNKSSDDIYVYKRVNHDSALCNYCKKAYLMPDGITPRVYKLSELQQNGTNYGKNASSYLPTITPLHVNCRCSLVEIPSGWHFNEKGQMTYKEPDYIHYKKQ